MIELIEMFSVVMDSDTAKKKQKTILKQEALFKMPNNLDQSPRCKRVGNIQDACPLKIKKK